MSTKISEMYAETSIQDLPDEMLEHILLYLNLDDRRSALSVCRRWSTLKPFDWSSVQLVVDFYRNRGQEANYHRTLLASSRQYKHLVFYFGKNSRKYELLVEILQHFNHKVETLKLIPHSIIPVEQTLLTQVLSLCTNLSHLHVCSANIDFGPHDLKISPMHKLEGLYLGEGLFSAIPNMMNITPNITRLHMQVIHSEEMMLLRQFCSQLVELDILLLSKHFFLTVCEMQFPLLEKLNIDCDDFEINPDGSIDEVEMINLFFHQIPVLKEVTLHCQLDDRVIQNLCRACVNIQFLCIRMGYLSQDSFRVISNLKHLKRLRIENATLDVPSDMCSPNTSLQKLTLYCTNIVHPAEFNNFVQRVFPNLAVMELLHLDDSHTPPDWSTELHGQICSSIPSLQRLVVNKDFSDIMLGQFLEFCASHAPKELWFNCFEIMDTSETEIHNRIPVQKLVLDPQLISPIVLQKLISSMEELRWLEIVLNDNLSSEEISSLQEQFPRCNVVVKRTVVIEESF